VKRSLLLDLSLVNDIDYISVHDCFYAMSHCDGSEAVGYLVESRLDKLLVFAVEG